MSEKGTTGFKSTETKVFGNYRAKVEDTTDPLQLGRIKARIYPYYKDIDVSSIPWSVPASPILSGAGTGFGSFAVPEVGSFVWCFFEAGDIYQPVYFAEAQTAQKGLPDFRTTNYPHRRGFKTVGGVEFYMDSTSEELKTSHIKGVKSTGGVTITASTGESITFTDAYIQIDLDGKVTIYSRNNITIESPAIKLIGNVDVSNGATGVFSTTDGKTVTVSQGIVTNIKI